MGDEDGENGTAAEPVSAEGIGMLVAFLDKGEMNRRRPQALQRLATLRASDAFNDLPKDLRLRIRELVAESEQQAT